VEPLINRVAQSEIDVFDLETLWDGRPIRSFDLAPHLEDGFVLREKEFRAALAATDWQAFAGTHVAVHCSSDAIVPFWAFMLVGSRLDGIAASVAFGREEDLVREYYARAVDRFDWSVFRDRIVVVKGCASRIVPTSAYLLATQKLQEVARKLMYGEPCSSVPLWRRPASVPEIGAKR
jgi:hypothetical protein